VARESRNNNVDQPDWRRRREQDEGFSGMEDYKNKTIIFNSFLFTQAVQEKYFFTSNLAFAAALQKSAETNKDRCLDPDTNYTRSTNAATAYEVI